jgi:hypothetical protein
VINRGISSCCAHALSATFRCGKHRFYPKLTIEGAVSDTADKINVVKLSN